VLQIDFATPVYPAAAGRAYGVVYADHVVKHKKSHTHNLPDIFDEQAKLPGYIAHVGPALDVANDS
jgi:hypothetical protein